MYENIDLFKGMTKQSIDALKPIEKKFAKGQTIISEGSGVNCFGIVSAGNVRVFTDDFNGNRNLILSGGPGFVFGESLTVLESDSYPVSVVASSDCIIVFIPAGSVKNTADSVFLHNILKLTAANSLNYRQKLTITGQRSTREKLLSFLSVYAKKSGKNNFYIPFSRQELADYLCVERSAMSTEIGKLVKDGIIRTDKNWFQVMGNEID